MNDFGAPRMEPGPPGEEGGSSQEVKAQIQSTLDQFNDSPLVGLEYIVEIVCANSPPKYHCFLCDRDFEAFNLISDVLSAEHRFEYLKTNFPLAGAKFAVVPNIRVWEQQTLNFLESCALRIQTRFGRLKPIVVTGEQYFIDNKHSIYKSIQNGNHFREGEELNFMHLPDPFASYYFRLDKKEIVKPTHNFMAGKPDEGLEHIKNPELQSLMQREIARFRDQKNSTSKTEDKKLNRNERSSRDHDDGTSSKTSFGGFAPKSPEPFQDHDRDRDRDRRRRKESEERGRTRRQSRERTRRSPSPTLTLREKRERLMSRSSELLRRSPSSSSASASREKQERRSSRSRERERERERKRSRSLSPFTLAHNKWSKFHKAERVMLSSLNRKKSIYDKRPEDHPLYGKEWTQFWEMRYREVQEEGGNPDEHDYKEDWIPFWGRRVTEIFEAELNEKTKDLLQQFDLRSAEEPRRSDFDKERKTKDGADKEKRDRERRPNNDSRRGERRERDAHSPNDHHGSRSRLDRSPLHHHSSRMDGADARSTHGWQDTRSFNNDSYSGITALEEKRDRGVSPSGEHRPQRSFFDHRSPKSYEEFEDAYDGPVMLVPCLRQLTALEDILGSLGPQVNVIMAKALALDQTRAGSSNLLTQNPDIACILDMVKEKLSGQMVAGLLEEVKLGAVRVAMSHLVRLLRSSTKKRPLEPPSLASATPIKDEKTKFKEMVAEQLAKILIKRDRGAISNYDLHCVVFQVIKGSVLDDGTIEPPPPVPPTEPMVSMPPTNHYKSYSQPNNYNPNMVSRGPETQSVTQNKDENEAFEDFEELSIEELRSLLSNFQDLSKQEQKDLIQYMRKLERTDPQKVALLKAKNENGSGSEARIESSSHANAQGNPTGYGNSQRDSASGSSNNAWNNNHSGPPPQGRPPLAQPREGPSTTVTSQAVTSQTMTSQASVSQAGPMQSGPPKQGPAQHGSTQGQPSSSDPPLGRYSQGGPFQYGPPQSGAPQTNQGGPPNSGAPQGGPSQGGLSSGEPPHGGPPQSGAPQGGYPQGGTPYSGTPYGGAPYSGAPYGGSQYGMGSYGGPPYGGQMASGHSNAGPTGQTAQARPQFNPNSQNTNAAWPLPSNQPPPPPPPEEEWQGPPRPPTQSWNQYSGPPQPRGPWPRPPQPPQGENPWAQRPPLPPGPPGSLGTSAPPSHQGNYWGHQTNDQTGSNPPYFENNGGPRGFRPRYPPQGGYQMNGNVPSSGQPPFRGRGGGGPPRFGGRGGGQPRFGY